MAENNNNNPKDSLDDNSDATRNANANSVVW
jgi:hypothetical protein